MKLQTLELTAGDFSHLKGKRLLTGKDIELVEEVSYEVHVQTDLLLSSFWATEIQDIIENKCVVYTPEDIRELNFLGLRIKARDNELELSLGEVGNIEPVCTIFFNKEVDNEGFQVLGDMVRFTDESALVTN